VFEQLLCRQIAGLPPIENRVGDIRREIAEADKTSEIGRADAFALGKRSKGNVVAADEGRVKPARLEEQLDLSRVRFRRSKRISPVDHHSDFPSGPEQPYWYGHDLGFVIDHALYWGCSYIEERVELTRAEADFDLVDAHLDPFDQGSKNSMRACYGELGPALSDLLGSRGKPPLRGRIREPRRSRLVDAAATAAS
jgi:hypothetical protein